MNRGGAASKHTTVSAGTAAGQPTIRSRRTVTFDDHRIWDRSAGEKQGEEDATPGRCAGIRHGSPYENRAWNIEFGGSHSAQPELLTVIGIGIRFCY
jgi:hypothetical protein